MEERPQLSPELRPLRYCPNCGERVAQQSKTCFMCGSSLQASERRRFGFPVADLLLVMVILGIAYLWWTRGPSDPGPAASPTSSLPIATVASTPVPTTAAGLTGPSPTPTVTPTVTPTPTPHLYTVVRGDTVERIAAEFDISVEDLMIANGLTSDLIRVDQTLVIPPGPLERGTDGRPLPTATPTPVSAIYMVQVRTNDTLETIAQRLGTSVEAIIRSNDWVENADTIIRPGDRLVVPVGTVLPTLTPVTEVPPTATPVPTFTPTPGPRWTAPNLLGPQDSVSFEGEDVLLQWLSVGLLDPDEVYVVRVVPDGRRRQVLTAAVVGTSFRVPMDWLAQQARLGNRFRWTVQVARKVPNEARPEGVLQATSSLSEARSFVWEGG